MKGLAGRYSGSDFISFTYGGRKCEFSVNLGGNARPGSRPKRTEEPGYFSYITRRKQTMTVWDELKARGLIAQVTDSRVLQTAYGTWTYIP